MNPEVIIFTWSVIHFIQKKSDFNRRFVRILPQEDSVLFPKYLMKFYLYFKRNA